MKNIRTVKGVMRYFRREKNSHYGNPRHSVMINGTVYRTMIDSALGCGITNFIGNLVEAQVGDHYGVEVIINVEKMGVSA